MDVDSQIVLGDFVNSTLAPMDLCVYLLLILVNLCLEKKQVYGDRCNGSLPFKHP